MQRLVVLQCQPLAEQDWLLDCFSRERGRHRLTLKRPSQSPDLFIEYQGDWLAKTEWPSVKAWQAKKHWYLDSTELYCGLYLNELMVNLLPLDEPLPSVFNTYITTLQALTEKQWSEPWLRMFEWQLLQQLGYGFSWHNDNENHTIEPHTHYQFIPATGFVKADSGFKGEDIIAFAQGSKDVRVWRLAKPIFRLALDQLLAKPLSSRALFFTNLNG